MAVKLLVASTQRSGPAPSGTAHVGQAPEGRALDVDERGDPSASPARGVHRIDDVDGLAALGQRQHRDSLGQQGAQIARTRRPLATLDAPARDPGQEIVRGQCRVAGRAAAHDVDVVGVIKEVGERRALSAPPVAMRRSTEGCSWISLLMKSG